MSSSKKSQKDRKHIQNFKNNLANIAVEDLEELEVDDLEFNDESKEEFDQLDINASAPLVMKRTRSNKLNNRMMEEEKMEEPYSFTCNSN